jgi:predicted NBD/HSP70 family sugar kinase
MYAGVDIGGTKTLVAALDDNGVIVEKIRFETPKTYEAFLDEFKKAFKQLEHHDFSAGGVGAPGKIDPVRGCGVWFGNLTWENVPLDHDIERIMHCPMVVKNDAQMAALSEAMLLKETYHKVLYVTVSTGIGYGLVVDGVIDEALSAHGGKNILVEHHGRLVPWESFASGRAIVKRYGKRASEITDEKTWRAIVRDLRPGLLELIAITEPEVIVFGGSVGTYFDRWGTLLQAELDKLKTPLVSVPKLMSAQRPEEAVLFGCYDLAKETFPLGSHAHVSKPRMRTRHTMAAAKAVARKGAR